MAATSNPLSSEAPKVYKVEKTEKVIEKDMKESLHHFVPTWDKLFTEAERDLIFSYSDLIIKNANSESYCRRIAESILKKIAPERQDSAQRVMGRMEETTKEWIIGKKNRKLSYLEKHACNHIFFDFLTNFIYVPGNSKPNERERDKFMEYTLKSRVHFFNQDLAAREFKKATNKARKYLKNLHLYPVSEMLAGLIWKYLTNNKSLAVDIDQPQTKEKTKELLVQQAKEDPNLFAAWKRTLNAKACIEFLIKERIINASNQNKPVEIVQALINDRPLFNEFYEYAVDLVKVEQREA